MQGIRKLLTPEIATMAGLFENIEPYDRTRAQARDRLCPVVQGMRCGPFLTITGKTRNPGAFLVTPTKRVVEALQESVLAIDRDVISFKIVVRNEDALVIAQHNQILADRWLTFLPLSQLPAEPLDQDIEAWLHGEGL